MRANSSTLEVLHYLCYFSWALAGIANSQKLKVLNLNTECGIGDEVLCVLESLTNLNELRDLVVMDQTQPSYLDALVSSCGRSLKTLSFVH